VLNYFEGGDLRYHLSQRAFKEVEAKFFVACILQGLEYIHEMKIIHRDIKPENLVFGADGYLHITDFGIARHHRDGNSEDTSGTPGYMAPEVLLKKSHTFNSDLYAVGVILYEVIMKKVCLVDAAAIQRQNAKRNTRIHRTKRNQDHPF